ncbi:MAG: hypothetical protein IPK98_19525 [Chloracidobacterium sp.]|nr:hypothetical protein [Chloracidobacterium sp.]
MKSRAVRQTDERVFDPRELEDAKRLYLRHGTFPPRQLKIIQREMRELGWEQFNYLELQGRYPLIGLIEEFGWDRVRLEERIGEKAKTSRGSDLSVGCERIFPSGNGEQNFRGTSTNG